MGRTALKLFGVELPERDFRRAWDRERERISSSMEIRTYDDLLHFPITTDPAYRLLISLMVSLRPAVQSLGQ